MKNQNTNAAANTPAAPVKGNRNAAVVTQEGNSLILKVIDVTREFGVSASGKTINVAFLQQSQYIDGIGDVTVQVTCYKKAQ